MVWLGLSLTSLPYIVVLEGAWQMRLLQGCRQGGGAGGAEAPPPQILTHVTLLQKNLEKQERKKQLLGYKHAALRHFQPTCMV